MALTLRLLGGLETGEIARAFLVPEATLAQRIVRAKKALVGQSYELPPPDQWAERSDAVLAVVYPIFNQGHADVRTELCDEALRLVRQLQHLPSDEGEVQGRPLLRSRPRACQRGWMPKASPCCCWSRTAAVGPAAHPPRGLAALVWAEQAGAMSLAPAQHTVPPWYTSPCPRSAG